MFVQCSSTDDAHNEGCNDDTDLPFSKHKSNADTGYRACCIAVVLHDGSFLARSSIWNSSMFTNYLEQFFELSHICRIDIQDRPR